MPRGNPLDKMRKILKDAPAPATELREYKRYIKWLESHGLSADERGRWITSGNLNRYYQEHVALERRGNRDSIRRIGNSLEWFAKHREWVLEPFVVKTPVFEAAVATAESRQRQHSNDNQVVTDPHKGLKDLYRVRQGEEHELHI